MIPTNLISGYRRTGRTTALAAIVANHLVVHPKAKVVWVSPTAMQLNNADGLIYGMLEQARQHPCAHLHKIDVGNSQVQFVSANSQTARGQDCVTMLVIDDSNMIPDLDSVTDQFVPCLTQGAIIWKVLTDGRVY